MTVRFCPSCRLRIEHDGTCDCTPDVDDNYCSSCCDDFDPPTSSPWTTSSLTPLAEALFDGRWPPLDWVMAHSLDERDPLHVAWSQRNNPRVRIEVLAWIDGWDGTSTSSGMASERTRYANRIDQEAATDGYADDAIRRYVTDLPTLQGLLTQRLARSRPEF